MYKKIVDLAMDCCWNGDINQISAKTENTYEATITRQESLSVILKLANDSSICWQESNCSCGQGPYCQHILAVFFALRQESHSPTDYSASSPL